MNRCLAVIAVCAAAIFAPSPAALADPPAAAYPWDKAQAVLKEAQADIQQGGIMAVRTHAPDMEQALAEANRSFDPAASDKDTVYVLADGPTETLLAMTAVAGGQYSGVRKGVAVVNPFPAMSFYLGSYYNELGQPAEALRVLDAGLALPTVMDQHFDAHRPFLVGERGAALAALKRWPDALANYDGGLRIAGLTAQQRAYLLRGRGFALTELGRLDDAEKSYRDSLEAEPGNTRALGELQYIAGLKAGKPATAGVLTMPNAAKPK